MGFGATQLPKGFCVTRLVARSQWNKVTGHKKCTSATWVKGSFVSRVSLKQGDSRLHCVHSKVHCERLRKERYEWELIISQSMGCSWRVSIPYILMKLRHWNASIAYLASFNYSFSFLSLFFHKLFQDHTSVLCFFYPTFHLYFLQATVRTRMKKYIINSKTKFTKQPEKAFHFTETTHSLEYPFNNKG